MNLTEFNKTLAANEPPSNMSVYLRALWYDAKEDWETAHTLIQDLNDADAAWIHAYLHRKEGDSFNARYWYNRANQPFPALTIAQEWQQLVDTYLN